MTRCKLCVLPDTRPDTAFVDGVCSACLAYQARPKIDWQARHEQLLAVLGRARATARQLGNHYDVVVPSSGGKDSHYQVLTLQALGARPLVVTARTCHLTPMGRYNIDNLARHASTIEVVPNMRVRAQLNRLGLTTVGDISWPEHVSIFTMPFRVASRVGIPFIFYGENPQNQYGAPSTEHQEAQQMTARWVSEFGGFLGLRPQDLVGVDGLTEADMADYITPAGAMTSLEAHFLGQYIPWDSHRNAAVAIEAGMYYGAPCRASAWTHENLDNAQTGIHDHGMYLKFGYGRGAAQLSVDIRSGLVTREQALAWVEQNDGAFPEIYAGVGVDVMLARLGMTRVDLMRALEQFTNRDIHPKAAA